MARLVLLGFGVTLLAITCLDFSAYAELGPCKPFEQRDVLICGSGNGAAIAIPDTLSPSGRLALAWRTPDAPPTEQAGDDTSFWSPANWASTSWPRSKAWMAGRTSLRSLPKVGCEPGQDDNGLL